MLQKYLLNVSAISSSLAKVTLLSIKLIVSLIYFIREIKLYSLPTFLIISNIVDLYIRKIMPFSFLEKIYTVVSLRIV